MIIIGIDPGVSGAISILENKKVIKVFDMPTMIDGKKNKRQVNGSQVTNIVKENLYDNKETIVVVEIVEIVFVFKIISSIDLIYCIISLLIFLRTNSIEYSCNPRR